MKSLLGDINIAREYFETFLPENLKKILDLSLLEHAPNSFISDRLQETMADIVFKCPLKDGNGDKLLYLSLIFEHRSTPYKFVSIQIGGYLFDAYREQIKNNQDPLIPVIPFLYYHGAKKWEPADMNQLFGKHIDDVGEFIPMFKFLFENIQNYSDEQIRQLSEGLLTSALLTQKYAGKPELLIDKFTNIFSILNSWDERNLIVSLIVYYFDLAPLIEEKQLNLLLDQIPKVMKLEFVSMADHLRQKGSERKNRTATEKMLKKGMDVFFICDVLDVTPEFVEEVRKTMKRNERNY